MQFKRHFVKRAHDPYQGLKFEKRKAGKTTSAHHSHETKQIWAPASWSQLACDILAEKYLRATGHSNETQETDCRQAFHRLAGSWTDWGRRYGYFSSQEDQEAFYDEVCYMLAHQIASPNSPQWFNTGLFFAYGLKGAPQGHYYVDPENGDVRPSNSAYERPQVHACFIQSVKDDLLGEGGIMDLWTREARIFKFGSGTGTNFSTLRAASEPLSYGGNSSGLIPFLELGDRCAASIKSAGTFRRAAKMVCLDADHPEIFAFVRWKALEEYKVASLIAGSHLVRTHTESILDAIFRGQAKDLESRSDQQKNPQLASALENALGNKLPMGYLEKVIALAKQQMKVHDLKEFTADWNGDAYHSVSGQNANLSVRLSHEFMEAVIYDQNWNLYYRTSEAKAQTIKARELWNEISFAAWSCADPGIQFDTTINEWHTCPQDGRIRASNPCSEYMFLDDTACNLASLNLIKFLNEKTGAFDIASFQHACRIWSVVLDISVQMSQLPSPILAKRTWEYRTIGLGYANLGALLMRMGLSYGSSESTALTAGISALMTAEAYATSADLALELGAFPAYPRNAQDMQRVLRNHLHALSEDGHFEGLNIQPKRINKDLIPRDLYLAAIGVWRQAIQNGSKAGFRNAQVTAIAPTGTIGLLMDCDTTGIEPDYSLIKYKQLASGRTIRILNQSVEPALERLQYSKEEIKQILRYCMGQQSLKESPYIDEKSLKAKGFTEKTLTQLSDLIPEVNNIFELFSRLPDVQTIDAKASPSLKSSTNPAPLPFSAQELLQALGYNDAMIASANAAIFGAQTLEGAPCLKKEHLAIFDCAHPSNNTSKRALSCDQHLAILAAAQPFVSGAISKTINLPHSASIQEIEDTFIKAWQWMLKSVAVYRDGSKLSQPLSAFLKTPADALMNTSPQSFAQDFPDETCLKCGFLSIVRVGSCFYCLHCGTTLACS